MSKIIYNVGSLAAMGVLSIVMALALLPVFLSKAARGMWKRIELHAIYGGDLHAQRRDDWRRAFS